jgi:hypothetical protein
MVPSRDLAFSSTDLSYLGNKGLTPKGSTHQNASGTIPSPVSPLSMSIMKSLANIVMADSQLHVNNLI